MRSKKSIFNQFHISNGKTIISLIALFILLWITARPLKFIGQNVYLYFGTVANNVYQLLPDGKSKIDEIIQSEAIIDEQSETIYALNVEKNYLENLLKETESIYKIADVKKTIKYKTNLAKVIGRTGDNWHKQIIINQGSKHNIKKGNTVLSVQGIVGQIVEVNKKTSVVQLTSDPNFKVGCNIKEREIIGILSGKTNKLGILHYIPLDADVKIGDIVETSGISASTMFPTYPTRYPIGKIAKIGKKKHKESDLYVEVKLFENLNSINNVLVFSPS